MPPVSRTAPEFKSAIRHLRRADPRLREVIGRVGPCTLRPRPHAFRCLVEAIVAQQISGKAATAILARFRLLFPGGRFPNPAQVLVTGPDRLRGAGLSNQKAIYVRDLAARFLDGTVRPNRFARQTDDEIVEQLIQVKGVGRWTAEMFLIFCLNRPDVLPVDDLGLRKAAQQVYRLPRLPDADTLSRLAEPWRPYCTVATWYLWRSLESF
jgi:DNA-3-methyladenine glycosylase II